MVERFNLALIFDDDFSKRIINYAQRLNQSGRSKLQLGQSSRPHLTIIQFDSSQEKAKKLWTAVSGMKKEAISIYAAGLTFLPSSGGGAWIEIAILKSKALLDLQEFSIATLPDVKLVSDVRDAYRPHITLARFIEGEIPMGFPLDYEVLRASGVLAYPAIGRGTHFEGTPVFG